MKYCVLIAFVGFMMSFAWAEDDVPAFNFNESLSLSDRAILDSFDDMGEVEVAKVNINSDKEMDYIVRQCSASYGVGGCAIRVYTSTKQEEWNLGAEVYSVMTVAFPGTRTQGYLDLYFLGHGMKPPKLWKWNGQKYE